ncbi:MAG: hypothetical protein M3Y75_01925 [Actinomycetota bacterium]|nr:hypothetical protein [Actinomycetota bacterium]
MNRGILPLLLLVALAFAIAGCGGEDDDGPGPGAYGRPDKEKPASEEESEKPKKRLVRASIWRANSEDIEKGLFEFDGFTLYRFDKDQGSKPTCYGPCAKRWPPLVTEAKPYGVDVVKSKLGTTRRKDGTLQVTYFGYPLYTFTGDKITGEVNGNGVESFGGTWHALRANGQDAKS